VVGFEWGYSLDSPDALVCWEAQFGDFVNVAQVIIDQFISSSEDKWHRLSGLVMLLPHGMEGQGPEHSSARLERFLLLCAEDNMQVVNLTTPAQLFHCLRRQVLRPWRKPLIVMSPKSLLRHRRAISTMDELAEGSFQRIIPDDPAIDPGKARRVVLCTGKIYYDLLERRERDGIGDVGIMRIEQLYPLRASELQASLAPYPNDVDLVWVQEEPWNMGAWYFMRARLPEILGNEQPLRCIARQESASPATGSGASHKLEQEMLLNEVFA
jgi:2-oxoglutarate dehydrogenase E1 component